MFNLQLITNWAWSTKECFRIVVKCCYMYILYFVQLITSQLNRVIFSIVSFNVCTYVRIYVDHNPFQSLLGSIPIDLSKVTCFFLVLKLFFPSDPKKVILLPFSTFFLLLCQKSNLFFKEIILFLWTITLFQVCGSLFTYLFIVRHITLWIHFSN